MDEPAGLDERRNGKAPDVPAIAAGVRASGRSLTAWALWTLFAVGLALFLLVGRAPIENGILTGAWVSVARLWRQYTGLMRAWGFGDPLIVAVWALGGVGLALSVAAVWFAFAARDEPDVCGDRTE